MTGLHGANRLASNSLSRSCSVRPTGRSHTRLPSSRPTRSRRRPFRSGTLAGPCAAMSGWWSHIPGKKSGGLMWDYVGVMRSNRRLARARRRLTLIQEEIRTIIGDSSSVPICWKLRNVATVAGLIIECASRRKESRGLHATVDYPDTDEVHWQRDTVIAAPQAALQTAGADSLSDGSLKPEDSGR